MVVACPVLFCVNVTDTVLVGSASRVSVKVSEPVSASVAVRIETKAVFRLTVKIPVNVPPTISAACTPVIVNPNVVPLGQLVVFNVKTIESPSGAVDLSAVKLKVITAPYL